MLGVMKHSDEQFEEAIGFFERALAINPHYTEAALNLAVSYNDTGQYSKAQELYDRARSLAAPSKHDGKLDTVVRAKLANMHAELGDLYRGLGCYAEAEREFQQALYLRDDFPDIRTKLADTYSDQGKYHEALKELQNVVNAHPHFLRAKLHLALVYSSMGQKGNALRELNRVLAKDPDNARAKIYLRLIQSNKG